MTRMNNLSSFSSNPLCGPVCWPVEVYPSIRHRRALRYTLALLVLWGLHLAICPRAALDFAPPQKRTPAAPPRPLEPLTKQY